MVSNLFRDDLVPQFRPTLDGLVPLSRRSRISLLTTLDGTVLLLWVNSTALLPTLDGYGPPSQSSRSSLLPSLDGLEPRCWMVSYLLRDSLVSRSGLLWMF